MTQQTLRELVELAERIPDAPWFTVDSVWLPGPDVPTYVIAGDSDPHVGKPVVDAFLKDEFSEGESEEDAVAEADAIMAFCAAARNAIPHLKSLLGEQREAQGADMVLVPREPTEAMLDAAFYSHPPNDIDAIPGPRDVWRAMLAAAPSAPPLAESVGDVDMTPVETMLKFWEDDPFLPCAASAVDRIKILLDFYRRHMQQGK